MSTNYQNLHSQMIVVTKSLWISELHDLLLAKISTPRDLMTITCLSTFTISEEFYGGFMLNR